MKNLKRVLGAVLVICLAFLLAAPAVNAVDVMTVLGPISVDKMGVTLVHEHLAFNFPGWYADESMVPYDRKEVEEKCLKVLNDIKAVGVNTIIEAGMCDTGGRDPVLWQNLARKSGINIIVATGFYYEGQGAPHYFKFLKAVGHDVEQDLYELFKREITVGILGTDVKAGVIKVASDDPEITDFEKTVFKAAVRAAKETGVPIITHTQKGSVGPAQQALFLEAGGNPHKIMIGHQNNSTDINYHLSELEKPGFYLGFDRTSLGPVQAEDVIIELVKKGYAHRICLSHDSIAVWLGRSFTWPDAWKGMVKDWYPTYIHQKLIPKMKAAGVTDDQIKMMLVDNPRRLFTGESLGGKVPSS